jgi:DNA polymerase-3 subunit delta
MDAQGLKEKLNTAPADWYVFGGEEEYLKRYYLSLLRARLVPDEAFAAFNHVVFDGAEVDFGALADAIKAPPMMAEYKLVEWRYADFEKMKEREKAALSELLALKKEYSYTALVFVTTAEGFEMGTQKRPGKLVTKYGKELCIVDFALSTENALLAWLKKHFDAEGIAVTAQPLRELLLLVGNSMDLLSHEVKKLSAYLHANARAELTVADVHAVAAGTVRSDAFALSNAVYEGNRTLALDAIREMKAERIDSIVALGMLIRIYQELLPIAILAEEGKEPKDIEAALKINPFRLKHMFKAARSIGISRLGECIAALSDMDVASKNGGGGGYSAIEMFLLQYL